MSQWPVIGVLLLGVAGLMTYCVLHDGAKIQNDIQARTLQTLKEANIAIPPGGVSVDGRDVTLTGVRNTPLVSDSTRNLVAAVWGVRDPVHLAVSDPPPPPPPPPMPPEALKVEADLTKFLEGKTIRFEVASDVIHAEGRLVLDQVVRILAAAPAVAVDITGHTSNDGDLSFNLDLSRRRALAVKQYLVAKGIKAERLTAEGFGSAKPILPNDTPENRAKNRRIEFHASSRIPG
jgi:outer membrane protein OmpA-like peptidoglycan-associated protein